MPWNRLTYTAAYQRLKGMIQALPEGVVLGDSRNPPDESNIGQSALWIPLGKVSEEHRGRKIRTIGQILAYDTKTSLLLLSAPSGGDGPLATLLVDLEVPLLEGPNPAVKDIPLHDYAYAPPPSTPFTDGLVNRERLRIERGNWVTVVGWLEGQLEKKPKRVSAIGSYAPPLGVVLDAIHIANARPPPADAIYRGSLPESSAPQLETPDMSTPRPPKRSKPSG